MLDSEGKAELAQMLSEAYNVLSDENVTYDQVVEQCTKVAEWLDENGYTEDAMDEYAESVLGEMKGIAIRLDDTQKAEARHLFGSLQEFRSRIAGTYKLSDNGVPLDDIWNGLAIEHPAFFSADESSAGLPGSLVEAIDRLRNTKNLDQYQHMSVDDMMQKVYEGFWKAKRMTTVADKYQAKIDEIMKKHDAEIKELKQTSKNKLEDAVYRLRISMQAQQAVERAEFEADRKQMQRDYKRQMEQLRKEYSTDTTIMHREFMRILRNFDQHADKNADLKSMLDEELKKHKAYNKAWEQEFNRMLRMYESEGRNIQKLEDKITQMRESAKAKVESRRMTEERHKVKNAVAELNRMLTNPTKNSYVPTSLQASVAQLLNAVNLETRDYSELKARYREEIRNFQQRGQMDKMAESYRKLERLVNQESRFRNAMAELQTKYKSFEQSGDAAESMAYNQTIANLFDRFMQEVGNTPLHEMSSDQLQLTKDIIRGVTAQVRDANKLKAMGEHKNAVEMLSKWQQEMGYAFMPGKNYQKWLQRYWQQQMRPDTFFKATSGFTKNSVGEQIAKMFVNGNIRMLTVEQEFAFLFEDILSNKDAAKKIDKYQSTKANDLVSWGLRNGAGQEVKTTRGIMLQAYMLLKQEDSFKSLLYGRFKMPNMDSYYKGNHVESYGSMADSERYSATEGRALLAVESELEKLQKQHRNGDNSQNTANRIAELEQERERIVGGRLAELADMMNQIQAQLTDTDIALINLADAWYSRSGDLMSETYESLNGFKPKRVKNYTPIHRDASTIFSANTTAAVDIVNLSNAGFTQERVQNTNPILLTDFFEELGQQRSKVARYYGFAQVQQDFNKLYKTKNPATGMTANSKLESIFGTGETTQTKRGFGVTGTQWINNFIADVAGSRQGDNSVMGWLYGNAAAATLGANVRVALSQLASIPTAAAEVGMKNMIRGAATGFTGAFSTKEREALAQRNVYFWQRYRGEGSSRELADIRNSGGLWAKVSKSKVGKAILNWCQSMDVLATGKMMWNMAEYAVQDTGVKPGDANYEQLVNEKYTDILRKTQPNYTTTERSDLLRDKRGGIKFLTMYKTQSNQNLNIMMEANMEYNAMVRDLKAGRNGVTQADVDAARSRLGWSYSSLITATMLFAAMRFIGNGIIRAFKPYKDDETGETDIMSILAGVGKDAFSSIAGMLNGGSIAYDAAMAVFTKGNYYGISDSAFGLIGDSLEAGVKWLQDTGDMSKLEKAVFSSAKLIGIPADNAKKILNAFKGWYEFAADKTDFWGDDEATKKQLRNRIVQAYLDNDNDAMAKAMMSLMEQSNKILESEQRSEVYSAIQTNEIKDLYISGKWDKEKTTNFLRDALEREKDKIDDAFTNWDFEIKYPGAAYSAYREMSAKQKRTFESIQNEVGLKEYYLMMKEISKITGEDANGDGKTDTGSKKNNTVAYIMKLKISDAAKRIVWDTVKTWSDKGTPWE